MMHSAPRVSDVDFIHVTAVRHVGDHTLWLRFSDGVEGIANLSGYLDRPAFAHLRDVAAFARARLLDDYTVVWPGDVDIAPEALYDLTIPDGPVEKRDLARAFDDAEAQRAALCDRMPEISRFFGVVIRMFADDHSAPHFHARYGKHTLTVGIRDGVVQTHGFPPKSLQRVLEWHGLHRAELLENWDRMRRGEQPHRIEPLK